MMPMEYFIEDVADKIVEIIKSSNLTDLESVRSAVKTTLKVRLHDALRSEEQILQEEQSRLIEQQQNCVVPSRERIKLNARIQEIAMKRKVLRQKYTETVNLDHYNRLRAFLHRKGLEELLVEFNKEVGQTAPIRKKI